MLKKFYRKTLPRKKFDVLFQDVKIKQPKPKIQQSDLVTPEEMALIIESCNNVRDKAIFSTLYDSGCRIGELLLMRINSLKFDNYGAVLEVPYEGKTGTRSVRIVGDSVAFLGAWVQNHPNRNDLNAPLFCNISEGIRGRAMTYDDVHGALGKIIKRAKITKRIHPHLFRHTRATILASRVAEAPLEAQMGWVPGTKQMSTYVHLSGAQTDEAILKAYGIEVKDKTIQEKKPVKCPRCSETNPSGSKYCWKCWLPLDQAEALKMKEREEEESKAILDMLPEEMRSIYQNLPPGPARSDMLTLMLLQKEKSGELDLVKRSVNKKPEEKPMEKPNEPEQKHFNTGIMKKSKKYR